MSRSPRHLKDGVSNTASMRVRRIPFRLSLGVLIVGLVLTGALTATSRVGYLHTEQRLIKLQTQLTASALAVAPEDLERRLGQAVGVAAESSDPVATFRKAISSSLAPHGPFSTATLVQVQGDQTSILTHVGAKSIRPLQGSGATALFLKTSKTTSLITTRAVGDGEQRFGYLMSAVGPGGTFVASAGQDLPSNHKLQIPPGSPFSGLNVAIYYGKKADSTSLIETNSSKLPLSGILSQSTIPFGSSSLTLMISTDKPLAGQWSERLPWGIAIAGVLLALGIAAMTERIVRRRANAEILATENQGLYREQRNISIMLQRSILPKVLPSVPGVELAARYVPGESGVEVGGDWYSAIRIDDHRFAFVVGDVSGRGLSAATVMAGLRYTIRAYASLGFSPSRILEMASKEIDISSDKHFATVLIGVVDGQRREMTIANAGHPPALLLHDGVGEFISTPIGLPLGLGGDTYESSTFPIIPNSTLIAYTDGLIERRGESLDVGKQRLLQAASVTAPSVDHLLTDIMDDIFAAQGSDDDTAILGIRWLE